MKTKGSTVALLSDIHGNAVALEAVLHDIQEQGGAQEYWFLGDMVGYGPRPLGCIAMLHQPDLSKGAWLTGNHDRAAGLLKELGGECDQAAIPVRNMAPGEEERQILSLHARQLAFGLPEEQRYEFRSAPFWKQVIPGVVIAHGAVKGPPDSPENVSGPGSVILNDFEDARKSFQKAEELCMNDPEQPIWLLIAGHSHRPLFWSTEDWSSENWQWKSHDPRKNDIFPLPLGEAHCQRVFLNPGSVGQPRYKEKDDPRAAYALLDLDHWTVRFRRVEYPFELTQAEMLYYLDRDAKNLTRLSIGK